MNQENIVINRYSGGLGNQMFQYAFGLNLEKSGRYVIADTSWYSSNRAQKIRFSLETVFPSVLLNKDVEKVKSLNERIDNRGIRAKALNKIIPYTRANYLERREFEYDRQALQTKKPGVSGYWQCHQYVDNVSAKLKEQFVFANHLLSEIGTLLEYIQDSNAVFLHIRGGDYIGNPSALRLFGGICTVDYYQYAVSMIKNRLDNPLFWIFTNDKRYAKSILANMENTYFVSDYISGTYEDWIDLMMMSKCRHAIIANSSFSWWGAWLIENRNKVVIAPGKWVNRKQIFDICEPSWIKL